MSGWHARCSGSAADRFFACPGSVALCERAPPRLSDQYAAEGLMAHWVASQCLLFTQAATFYLGRRRDFGAHRVEVTSEMAEHVQGYVN